MTDTDLTTRARAVLAGLSTSKRLVDAYSLRWLRYERRGFSPYRCDGNVADACSARGNSGTRARWVSKVRIHMQELGLRTPLYSALGLTDLGREVARLLAEGAA